MQCLVLSTYLAFVLENSPTRILSIIPDRITQMLTSCIMFIVVPLQLFVVHENKFQGARKNDMLQIMWAERIRIIIHFSPHLPFIFYYKLVWLLDSSAILFHFSRLVILFLCSTILMTSMSLITCFTHIVLGIWFCFSLSDLQLIISLLPCFACDYYTRNIS